MVRGKQVHNDFLNGAYWTEDRCSESVHFNIDDFLDGDRHGDDHDIYGYSV